MLCPHCEEYSIPDAATTEQLYEDLQAAERQKVGELERKLQKEIVDAGIRVFTAEEGRESAERKVERLRKFVVRVEKVIERHEDQLLVAEVRGLIEEARSALSDEST